MVWERIDTISKTQIQAEAGAQGGARLVGKERGGAFGVLLVGRSGAEAVEGGQAS